MDILYATNTWCSTDHNRGRGNTDGPTIDDLISSMRSHFVDGPPLAGSGGPSEGSAAVDLGQRVHSSTRSTAKLGRSLAQFVREEQANTVPNPGWDVANNMDTVGVQFEVKDALFGREASGDTSSRQGSHQPSDGQVSGKRAKVGYTKRCNGRQRGSMTCLWAVDTVSRALRSIQYKTISFFFILK